MDSESNHQHDVVSSQSLVDETIVRTLTTLSLPTLPFDLIPEILSRLSVKLLLRFRLVHTLTVSSDKYVLKSYPLDSVFTNVTTNPISELQFPLNVYFVGSCNGILCFFEEDCHKGFVRFQLWNPSIRKFKELLPLQQPHTHYLFLYGFSHDPITNNYKMVVVLRGHGNFVDNHEVKVHTLGTNCWKSIQNIPFGCVALQISGKFVSGTLNWLVAKEYDNKIQIFSLDLGSETYKEVLLPREVDASTLHSQLHSQLGVLRDCLCMVFGYDVWVMKEYKNKESWSKLFTISHIPDLPTYYGIIKVLHIFEDGQVLLDSTNGYTWKLIFYNSRDGTYKFTEFEFRCEVCVESLISPCF
ncbi:F-box protein interaction domain protein [Medicago truncatula]|uniref:F-box protein interaction domain protein n=1 Tax=Medicago truncatula TaxID=3880 RepID=A0A072UU57_MEDTR|nr:F-box protein interaction domain protein [Medicago truncatula]